MYYRGLKSCRIKYWVIKTASLSKLQLNIGKLMRVFEKLFHFCLHAGNVKKPIRSNYHLSFHGHLCDGHFGVQQLLPHGGDVV
jgi:hypothetical protein